MVPALKLLLTPFFIAAVTLAGRRWGPTASGLLVGLPLTSGPVSLILALQYGRPFAAHAAIGSLCGQASVCIFCLAYSRVAQKANWLVSALAAMAAFLAATVLWNSFTLSLLPALALMLAVIGAALYLLPRYPAAATASGAPRWDLPARMIVATAFVILLTTFADVLGPQLSGLISPLPIFGLVLAAFTHYQQGPRAAATFLRGVVLGSWAFGCFFLVVGGLLPHLATGWTYALAALSAVSANATSFYLARRAASIRDTQ